MCSSQQSDITFSNEYEKIGSKKIGKHSIYIIKNTDEMHLSHFKQFYNPAPTLPIHSPHSPDHLNSYPNTQQRKLSSRYINNKIGKQKSAKKSLIVKEITKNPGCFSEEEILATITAHPSKRCRCTKSINQDDCLGNCAENNIVKGNPKENALKFMLENMSNQKDMNAFTHLHKKEMSTRDLKFTKYKIALDVNQKPRSSLEAQDNHNRHPFILKTSKSEQTSPNIIDYKKVIFDYGNNKKSADSLLRVSAIDPWIKKTDLSDYMLDEVGRSTADPWVKRPNSAHKKSSFSKERCQNGQLRSGCAKEDIVPETNQKSYLRPDMPQQQKCRKGESVLSAPPSPNLKNTSICDINYSQNKSFPTKSASFSPAKGKPLLSSFEDSLHVNLTSLQSIPINSTSVTNQNQLIFTENRNSNRLNVNNLLSRHSFSSISKPSKDELQLNIRRLSEQMGQMDNVQLLLTNDSSVNNKEYDVRGSFAHRAQIYESLATPTELEITDKTGFENILKLKKNCHSAKHNLKFSTVLDKTKLYISHQKPKPMPETTC